MTLNSSPTTRSSCCQRAALRRRFFLIIIAVILAPVPRGTAQLNSWFKAGTAPREYETGEDASESYSGMPSGYLKSLTLHPSGFGTLMRELSATNYRGQRVQALGVGEDSRCVRVGSGLDARRSGSDTHRLR